MTRAYNSFPCSLSSLISDPCLVTWLKHQESPEPEEVCKASESPSLKLERFCFFCLLFITRSHQASSDESWEIHWKGKIFVHFLIFILPTFKIDFFSNYSLNFSNIQYQVHYLCFLSSPSTPSISWILVIISMRKDHVWVSVFYTSQYAKVSASHYLFREISIICYVKF